MHHNLSDVLTENMAGLRTYAISKTGNPVDADDIVQECIRRALTYIRNGQEIRCMRAYLFTILRNVFNDELSRRRRYGTMVDIDDVSNAVSSQPQQLDGLGCRDLGRAVARLPKAQRQVMQLIGLDGRSYKFTADKLGIPIGTVMSRLCRARMNLRRALAAAEAECSAP